MAKLVGIAGWRSAHKKFMKKQVELAHLEVKRAGEIVQKAFFQRTPVWMGEAIVNYRWGVGAFKSGQRGAVGSGAPGKTNSMAMGQEPRRPANEAVVRAELLQAMASFTLEKGLYFSNNLEGSKWGLIEDGMAPTPGAARNPGGVIQIAMQTTRANLGQNWKA